MAKKINDNKIRIAKRPITKVKSNIINLRNELEKRYSPELIKIKNILDGISLKSTNNANAKFSDLYSLLQNPALLIQSLGKIRPNVGSSTPGIDKETLNKISMKKMLNLSIKLKNNSFKFSPVRRVYIPKPGKSKLRPLGIPTFSDRIVQEGIRIILESIYEPEFRKIKFQNYGFRTNKSAHESITSLQRNGTACNYAIEGDIVGAFDNVDISILINILRIKIKDEKFLALIKQGCYAGMLEFGEYKDTLLGVPQGGIASPLLFNIYMHEFDLYINNQLTNIIENYNKLHKRFVSKPSQTYKYRNPQYRKINYQLGKTQKLMTKIKNNHAFKDILPNKKQVYLDLIKKKRQLSLERVHIPSILVEKRPIRIVYSRYADDFIILTNANTNLTICIKKRLAKFLEKSLKLKLSEEKTKITNIKTDYAKFLGFVLYTYEHQKFTVDPSSKNLIRTAGYNIKIGIDMERVLNRMILKGFCNKTFRPIGKIPYSVLPIKEIIEKYNSIIRGTANYFIPMIDSFRPFTQIHYILAYSCYGTIAKKLNSSIFKIFKKFGKPPVFKVTSTIKSKKGFEETIENSYSIIPYLDIKAKALELKNKKIPISSDVFKAMTMINWRTYKNLDAYCAICGTHENVEWCHIKAIKKGKVEGFAQVMKQLNRKQIPLCKQHHYEVDKGFYNDIKISDLVQMDYFLA